MTRHKSSAKTRAPHWSHNHLLASAMVTKLRSGRSISNQSTQLPSQGSDTSFYTSQGSPPPELQQRSRSRSTPQSSNSSKSDTDTNLDVRLTSPPRRTRPIAPLCTYEKGLPKHLLKEIIQDIVAVGRFNSHRYNLADLRNANRDSYGNIAVRKQVENQVYRWKNFNQEQWTSLLDEYGLLQTPYASASAKPVKATSESEVVFASPVSASTKMKSKKQQPHQHFSSPSLSSNSNRTMSSMSWKMPPQMLAKYESGDYSTFGIGRQSDLARSFTHSHINSFSCAAEIDVNPHHPEQNLHVYVYPFSDAMHDGNTKVHDGFEIAIRGGADPQDFKNKKYKAFLPEEHGNEVFLLLPAIESSELYRGDEYYKMEQKKIVPVIGSRWPAAQIIVRSRMTPHGRQSLSCFVFQRSRTSMARWCLRSLRMNVTPLVEAVRSRPGSLPSSSTIPPKALAAFRQSTSSSVAWHSRLPFVVNAG